MKFHFKKQYRASLLLFIGMLAVVFSVTSVVDIEQNEVLGSEITSERTLSSKVYDLGNGQRRAKFYTTPIHYLDEERQYQDIDTTIKSSDLPGFAYQVEEGVYKTYFSEYFSDDTLVKLVKGEYEVNIASKELSLTDDQGGVSTPLARPQPVMGLPNKSTIDYKGAYGDGIDVSMSYGRTQLRRELHLESFDVLSITDKQLGTGGYLDLGFAFSVGVPNDFNMLVGDEHWDGSTTITSEEISFMESKSGETIFYFAPPVAIDAKATVQSLKFKIERNGNNILVTKLIPLQWLQGATYPVMADDSLTAYPTANKSYWSSNSSLATAHDALTGTERISEYFFAGILFSTPTYYVERAIMYFDTSSIGAGVAISSAVLKLYPQGSASTGTGWTINVVDWDEGPTMDSSDYDKNAFEVPDGVTNTYGSISIDSWTTSGSYNSITLSDTSVIDTTGDTYIGIRTSADINDTTPATNVERVYFYQISRAGTSEDPVLEIDYVTSDTGSTSQTVAINNAAPIVDTVLVSIATGDDIDEASIHLTESSATPIFIRGTVTDYNGCDDINTAANWDIVVYRTNVLTGGGNGYDCAAENSDCYYADEASNLTFSDCSGAGDMQLTFEQSLALQYYADATDAGTHIATDWTVYVKAVDDGTLYDDTTSDTFEMNSLLALSVGNNIDYGGTPITLGAETTGSHSTTITNTGNTPIDFDQTATSASSGDMVCTSGTIPVGNTEISLTAAFNQGAGQDLIEGNPTPAHFDLNLVSRTELAASTDELYFNLQMPTSGVNGLCTNVIGFTAKAD